MEKKALIVGSHGQLGIELVSDLQRRGYQIQSYSRAELDITDPGQVEQAVASFGPSVVLNAAAYNQVDLAEKEPQAAFAINSLAVRNLALACRQSDARLIHFSTDYVFDGTKGSPYLETDDTHPLGAYAVSKLAGELYAQAYLDAPLVIRTSGVFGPAGRHTPRGNFVELMLRLAHGGQPIRVVEDHIASPTYAPLLASRSLDLYEKGASGVFHIGGGTPISWYHYAGLIFRAAGVNPELRATNEREYRTAARRPKYSALSNSRMEAHGVEPFPSLENVLVRYFENRDAYAPRPS